MMNLKQGRGLVLKPNSRTDVLCQRTISRRDFLSLAAATATGLLAGCCPAVPPPPTQTGALAPAPTDTPTPTDTPESVPIEVEGPTAAPVIVTEIHRPCSPNCWPMMAAILQSPHAGWPLP
jgi:hypothetical protein